MTPKARRPPHEPDHECGAETRTDHLGCTQVAGYATDHLGFGRCKFHGGRAPSGKVQAQRLAVEAARDTYGLAREIDPVEAMLDELWRSYGHVRWLEDLIHDLDPAALVGGVRSIREKRGAGTADQPGPVVERTSTVASIPAAWLDLYQRERKHYLAVASDCVRLGLEARRMSMAEETGELVVRVLRGVLGELGLTGQEKVERAVARHLRAVA